MMNDGGPAFPLETRQIGDRIARGMTLRDYFAAKAMQAMLTKHMFGPYDKIAMGEELTGEWMAREAYQFADLMLKEREVKDGD